MVILKGELNPVASKAQKKVPIPEGLDLDEWINDPPSEDETNNTKNKLTTSESQMFVKHQDYKQPEKYTSLSSASTGGNINYGGSSNSYSTTSYANSTGIGARQMQSEISSEDLVKLKETRKLQNDSNPFYIKSSSSVKKSESTSFNNNPTISNKMHVSNSANGTVPNRSQSIDLKTALNIPGVTSSENYYRMNQIDIENKKLKKKMKSKDGKKKDKKGKHGHLDDEEIVGPIVKVLQNEMPEGANEDSDDDVHKNRSLNDPHRALDINLDE